MILTLALLAGPTPAFFAEVATLLVAGAAIAFLGYRLGFVPIVGFLLAGVVIGPNAAGLVRDPALVDAAAEVGVILLLFTIGIEFSLEKLGRIRRLILVGGGLQVVLATAATLGIVLLIGGDWRAGLFTGFLVALSSTAIVLKLLADRGETQSHRGQLSLALLIFQDLAIIAMVLTVPMLAGTGGSAGSIAAALATAGALIVAVLLIARRLMPRVLEAVARTCSPELFLLTVIAICFGTAYLTSLAGVSLSLGAFLAGLVVSESSFSEHALGEIMPLQILFSATFFVSVGMLLDPAFLFGNLPLVLGAVALVLVIKALTTGASVLALGYRLPVAASAGLILAQVGEFSFVLERAGREVGLYPAGLAESGSQVFIAATVLLMVATPALARLGGRVGAGVARRQVAGAEAAIVGAPPPPGIELLDGHIIVAGFGLAARQLVQALEQASLPFVITTLSPSGADDAERAGHLVLRGDSSRQRTLEHVGVDRARMLVIADDDPVTARRIATVGRALNPSLRIVVRTRHAIEAEPLKRAGADLVITDEVESIVQLFGLVLRSYGVDPAEVDRHETSVRDAVHVRSDGRQPFRSWYPIDLELVHRLEIEASPACRHVSAVHPVTPSAHGCEDCLATGDAWVHLRICMTCGHVGCCDSSRNKHATKHFRSTSHPIVRSLEPGEEWAWCYEDEVEL